MAKITITEATVTTGSMASVEIFIDDKKVRISVPPEVKAYFNAQFVRDKPSKLQRQKYTTLMTLLRAAYRAGQNSN